MPKRQQEDNSASSKRFRAAIDESIDGFLCPITQALPLDPVFAEDGQVYERTAIEEWLSKQQRSPVTNLAMGTKVFAATQVKTMIERMVKSDALPKDKVSAWRARLKEQEEVERTRRAADAGDAASAAKLGCWLSRGDMGLAKDVVRAFGYFKSAARAGDATAMGFLSQAYRHGEGIEKNAVLALRWAAAASALGNGVGMITLAGMYSAGEAGLPADKEEEFELRVGAHGQDAMNSVGVYNLAKMYAEGQGTAVDIAMATTKMREAIRLNDGPSGVEAARAWLQSRGLPLD